MARFFVTGGTGFVGTHLLHQLVAEGHRVACLARSCHQPRGPNGVEWIEGGLHNPEPYLEALTSSDYVLHLAGLISARRNEEYLHANVTGTATLLEACLTVGTPATRFVFMSSIAAMGPHHHETLLTETDPCRPGSAYGRSKLQAEEVVLRVSDQIQTVILRPTFIYGGGDVRGAVYLRAMLASSSRPWRSNIRTMTLCHVADVARICVLAAQKDVPSGEVFIVSDTEVHTWDTLKHVLEQSLLELAAEHPGLVSGWLRPFLTRVKELEVLAPNLDCYDYWGCDPGKLRDEFGYESSRSLRDEATSVLRRYLADGLLGPGDDRADARKVAR